MDLPAGERTRTPCCSPGILTAVCTLILLSVTLQPLSELVRHSNWLVARAQAPLAHVATPKASVFLFIGALSARHYRERREACRATWAVQVPGEVAVRFFIAGVGDVDNATALEIKAKLGEDIVEGIPGEITYETIGIMTLALFKYALLNFDSRFILKTDDDAYIVPAMVPYLRGLCMQPSCHHEKLYIGKEVTNREVRHDDVVLGFPQYLHDSMFRQTGLATYPAFMGGGGYVVSQDVASLVVDAVDASGTDIFETGPEDASFGFYASFIKLTRVNDARFGGPVGMPSGFPWDEQTPVVICAPDAPLIFHDHNMAAMAKQIFNLLRNCTRNANDHQQQM